MQSLTARILPQLNPSDPNNSDSYPTSLGIQLEKYFSINMKLSEQQIIDCSGNGTGCSGSSINQFINYVQTNGLTTTSA